MKLNEKLNICSPSPRVLQKKSTEFDDYHPRSYRNPCETSCIRFSGTPVRNIMIFHKNFIKC